MASIETWKQKNGIEIDEVDYDGDHYVFDVYVDGKHVVTIYPYSPEDTENIRIALNLGEDVRDFENGHGCNVGALIAERTGDGLRETLRRIEDEGDRYNRETYSNNKDGVIWEDKVNGIYYEYETYLDLKVDDLTDEDLKDIGIWGL